ncbi:MAG: HIT family protein, partial [Planctomycetota bacterium]
MAEDDCIFCKIVAKQVPATVVYEDEVVLAFLDFGPISDGHSLVVTKQHFGKLDECPGNVLSQVGSRLPKIAKAVTAAVDCDGYNLLCNNGRAAGQIVSHLH